jgi:hypothetical protein
MNLQMKLLQAEDFTENNYARLIELAAQSYRFVDLPEALDDPDPSPAVVWRHDVDYSPHRALALAQVEQSRGLRCVYHFMVSSRYYNVLEPEVSTILRRIGDLGHHVGLHFDMDVFDVFGAGESPSQEAIDRQMAFERDVLAMVLRRPLTSMSFHNVTLNAELLVESATIACLRNAQAAVKRGEFRYVSDSNGVWRYDRLDAVLAGPASRRLMVLTHPEWWTPEQATPFERLARCIAGRADANLAFYVKLLNRDGRLLAISESIGLPQVLIERFLAPSRED